MSLAWQRVHVELLEQGGLQVRTHEWRPPTEPSMSKMCGRPKPGLTALRRRRIRRWLREDPKKRLTERELAAQLEITRTSIRKQIRWIEAHG